MRSALLRGREHTELGQIDAISEDLAAIALSRGGARKTYSHADPNEDVAAFALAEGSSLIAVADGHSGFEASEVVIEHLLAYPAPQWTDARGPLRTEWERHAVAALCDANDEVLRERVKGLHLDSATTLCTALVRPEFDELLVLSVGDSLAFTIDAEGSAHELVDGTDRPTWFLGTENENPERLGRRCRVEAHSLEGTQAVVCVTDGLSEDGIGVDDPAGAVAEAFADVRDDEPGLRPIRLARRLCEIACASHRQRRSGDNVGVATVFLG